MKSIIVVCLMVICSPAFAGSSDWKYKKEENGKFIAMSAEVPSGASRIAIGYVYAQKNKRAGNWLIKFVYKGKTAIEKFRHFTVRFNDKRGNKAVEKRIGTRNVQAKRIPGGFIVQAIVPYRAVELIKGGYVLLAAYTGKRKGTQVRSYTFTFPLNKPDHVGSYAMITKLEHELKNRGVISCCKATGRPMPSKSNAEIAKFKEDRRRADLARERRQKEYKKKKAAKIRAKLTHFEFPDAGCTRPGVPSTRASDRAVDRANRKKKRYRRCLVKAGKRDQKAVERLVVEIGGSVKKKGNGRLTYRFPNKAFGKPLDNIIDHKKRRADRRLKRWRKLNKAVDRRNAALKRQEFWDGIQASTDRMARDMERQRRQQMQQWNRTLSQPYMTPGLR